MQTNLEWDTVPGHMLYQEAVKKVEALGDNWRMPTIKELLTLVDFTKIDPANSSSPALEDMPYWSTTPVVDLVDSKRSAMDAKHWLVDFYDGCLFPEHAFKSRCCVIAVREYEN